MNPRIISQPTFQAFDQYKSFFSSSLTPRKDSLPTVRYLMQIFKNILKKSGKTEKLEILEDAAIPDYNRRFTAPEKVPEKLRRSFEFCQNHLDKGWGPYWECAEKPFDLEIQVATRNDPVLGHVGTAWLQGRRCTMEDAHLATVLQVKGVSTPISLYGIFDGHGGDECANYLAKHLAHYLEEMLPAVLKVADQNAAIFNLLKQTFVHLGESYKRAYSTSHAGSTANIALIIGKDLWVANVGDSRSLISSNGKAIALSEDAKPDLPAYYYNVIVRGGRVEQWPGDIPRVVKNTRSALAMARGVGHDEIHSGVNPRAKITKISLDQLQPGQNYLVIGSDGLFDVASSNQIAQTVTHLLKEKPGEIASTLASKAFAAGSSDNISVLVADLSSLSR